MVTGVEVSGITARKIIVMITPVPNRIKSNGLNIPKIKFPFLVFAGIK